MDSINKIVIFGSTGKTGQCAVEAALDLGLQVTVLVRDSSRLPSSAIGRVTVVEGDVLNEADVEDAVRGQDAVVCVLGTRDDLSATTVMSEGISNILAAMARYGVNKVSACMSSFLFMPLHKVPERYLEVNADHQRMLDKLVVSDRDWVAVLPPHITEGPGREEYTVTHDKGPGRTIAKQDLGHFLVTCLNNPDNFGKKCGICDLPQ